VAAVATQSSDRTPTLRVANPELGDVLIDSENRTVYLFKGDNGATSTCFGACAHDWPPVRATGNQVSGKSTAGRSNGY